MIFLFSFLLWLHGALETLGRAGLHFVHSIRTRYHLTERRYFLLGLFLGTTFMEPLARVKRL